MTTKCGVLAIYNENTINCHCNIPEFIESLDKLQHRGQESCGMCYHIDNKLSQYKNHGLVKDVFKFILDNPNEFVKDKPKYMLGHTRYSTSGSKYNDDNDCNGCNDDNEIQPFYGKNKKLGTFSFVFNGNIPYRESYDDLDINFNYDKHNYLDTELIKSFLENSYLYCWEKVLTDFVKRIERAYCLIVLTDDGLYAVRDSFGVRPLCIGTNENNICISSESCAFLKYDFNRFIKPGEVFKVDTMETINIYSRQYGATCIFEYIYFLNKKSENVFDVREKFGALLASNEKLLIHGDENILVCGCPSTGITSAKKYAETMEYTYHQFIMKNKNSNRTFILKNDIDRDKASKEKYIINNEINLKDRDLVVVDDSIVRGITMKNLVTQLKIYEPRSIHIRVSAPPVKYPCYYGVDIPTQQELIAYNNSIENIRQIFKVHSIYYLEIEDLYKLFPKDKTCYGCFNEQYKGSKYEW